MVELKAGTRLKSAACETQIMIIKGLPGEHELACGGAQMIGMDESASAALDSEQSDGSLVGKRYVNESQEFEALCVKAGAGSLYLDGVPLHIKQAKILPSSD